MTFAYTYLVALGLFGLFDAIWLSVVANGFYKSKIGHWPGVLTVVDMAWGTIVTASVATITYLIFR